jgi:catechol 2,3-dioxygenase-like lactoylglutathione lyase family enzyme
MLASAKLMAFVGTTNADRARAFYHGMLGLTLVSEDGYGMMFESNGVPLRIAIAKELTPVKYTVLGWQVKDIRATVASLKKAGVTFELYSFLKQDELSIWTSPNGDQVAWFKDPDGNTLSVSQHVAHA